MPTPSTLQAPAPTADPTPDAPAPASQSLHALLQRLRIVWTYAGVAPGGAAAVVEQSLARAQCNLPARVRTRQPSCEALLADLEQAFAQHHPQEIHVAAYTLSIHVLDVMREVCGDAHARRLERLLAQDVAD